MIGFRSDCMTDYRSTPVEDVLDLRISNLVEAALTILSNRQDALLHQSSEMRGDGTLRLGQVVDEFTLAQLALRYEVQDAKAIRLRERFEELSSFVHDEVR
jgi:hypothetical protein